MAALSLTPQALTAAHAPGCACCVGARGSAFVNSAKPAARFAPKAPKAVRPVQASLIDPTRHRAVRVVKADAASVNAATLQAIPGTMKAAVCETAGAPLMLKDMPVPKLTTGQVLVKIVKSGVCHTDLHAVDGDWPVKPTLPLIPGHEGVGYVVAVDPSVTHLQVGDRVGVPWLHTACGVCEYCVSGWETVCPKQKNTGYAVNGGFAEYCVAQASHVGRIPSGLSFAQAAPILCAGVTVYKGLKETEVKPGQWVAIFGAAGGLGHVAVQYAVAMGMKVLAIDMTADKLAYCKTLGATAGVLATDPEALSVVQKLTGGEGVHGCLVLAPSPKAFNAAVSYLRRLGTAVSIALPAGDFPCPIFEVVLKRLTIRGSIVGTRKDLEEALQFAAEGKVKCTVELKPLAKINEIFADMKGGRISGRIVLDMDPSEK